MSRLEPTNGLGIVEVSAPRRANWVNRQAFPGSPYTELSTGILRLGEAGTAGEGTHLLRGGFIIAPAGGDVIVCPSAHPGAFLLPSERSCGVVLGRAISSRSSALCFAHSCLTLQPRCAARPQPTSHSSAPASLIHKILGKWRQVLLTDSDKGVFLGFCVGGRPRARSSRSPCPKSSRLTRARGTVQLPTRKRAWGRSSAGRALPSHGRGRGFDSLRLHPWI